MFTMRKIRNSTETNKSYLDDYLSGNNNIGDYYGDKNIIGQWIGKGCEQLGLIGNVTKDNEAFRKVEKNINPLTDKKLTPRNVKKAVRFYDFTCSAEKTVSIMAVTMQDHRITSAHNKAVSAAIRELERFAAVQVKQGNTVRLAPRITGNIICAMFQHDVSRELDPQLHTHCVVGNATYDSEKERFVALESRKMIEAIRYAGKVYQNELAIRLRKIGYDLDEKTEKGKVIGFKIKGVTEEIQDKFSKRRKVILKKIEQLEKEKKRELTTGEVQNIVLQTRTGKQKIDSADVLEFQKEQLTVEERKVLESLEKTSRIRYMSGKVQARPAENILSLESAIENLYERRSICYGHEIMAEVINENIGHVNIDQLTNVIKKYDKLIRFGKETEDIRERKITTLEGLQEEKWSVEFINRTKGLYGPINAEYRPYNDKTSTKAEENKGFDYSAQREIIKSVLNSQDQVIGIRGVAGAGKTTLLRELNKGMASGACKKVIFLSPTTTGKEVLKKEGFDTAETLQRFLLSDGEGIGKGSMLVVDESSLQSNSQGARLLKIAEDTGARVLLVGDTRQHSSVTAGDFLRILETYSNIAKNELNEIRRQKADKYRKAIEEMANGRVVKGLKILDENGHIIEDTDYIENSANQFITFTDNGKNLDNTVVVSQTNDEIIEINREIRNKLKQAGKLSKGKEYERYDSYNLMLREKKKIETYEKGMAVVFNKQTENFKTGRIYRITGTDPGKKKIIIAGGEIDIQKARNFDVGELRKCEISSGDRLIFTMNSKKHGIRNGETVKVIKADANGLFCKNKSGKHIRVPRNFLHLKYAYAITSYRSQGITCDNVIVGASFLDCKSAYVACSRGKYNIKIICPDKNYIYNSVEKEIEREAGFDVVRSHFMDKLKNTTIKERGIFYPKIKAAIVRAVDRIIKKVLRKNIANRKNHFKNLLRVNSIRRFMRFEKRKPVQKKYYINRECS